MRFNMSGDRTAPHHADRTVPHQNTGFGSRRLSGSPTGCKPGLGWRWELESPPSHERVRFPAVHPDRPPRASRCLVHLRNLGTLYRYDADVRCPADVPAPGNHSAWECTIARLMCPFGRSATVWLRHGAFPFSAVLPSPSSFDCVNCIYLHICIENVAPQRALSSQWRGLVRSNQ